ncbi:MAG: hypothetical protein PHI31_09075 [Desulfuromonadaceae bacterium]|nr:hypothetical protein [Desulfuromonadaceae bacterium]
MIIETITLDSALCITLVDQTQHYFGGYYHVKVLAYCDIPLLQSYFENDVEFKKAMELMGKGVRFERLLDKMAVPESDIESVRNGLTQSFHDTTKKYMSVPDFASRFVRCEYVKQVKNNSRVRIPRV